MKLRRLLIPTLVALAVLAIPRAAFAQDVVPQVTALTPSSVTIALLAALVAFLANAYNTGSFFGLKTVPLAVLPYLGVSVPFLSAVYVSLAHAGTLNGTSILNAVLSGVFAILGSASGAGAHVMLKTHFNAAAASKLKALFVVLALGGIVATQTACPQAVASIVPAIDCGVAIIEDAVAGMSIPDIVAKEESRCGADAEQIVQVLLESKDPRLVGKPAMADALARKAAGK